MREEGIEIEEGGTHVFDQGQAKALDAIRVSDAMFVVASQFEGPTEIISLIPQPQNADHVKWIEKFLYCVEKSLQDCKDALDHYRGDVEEEE